MTESNRATSEQKTTSNVEPLVTPSDGQRSTTSSPIGVYEQATTSTTSTTTSSSNLLWIILLLVLIVVIAFFVLRRWM